jgi:hypothetical protein
MLNVEKKGPVPQTPLRDDERADVKRPNRISLLKSGNSNLFSSGASVLEHISSPSIERTGIDGAKSPNPVELVHRIADLQKALRTVTSELETTKICLEKERRRNKILTSPNSVAHLPSDRPGVEVGRDNARHIMKSISDIATNVCNLEQSFRKQFFEGPANTPTIWNCTDEIDLLKTSQGVNSSGNPDQSNRSTSSTNNTKSTVTRETVRPDRSPYESTLKRQVGSPTNEKVQSSPDLWCGHGTPQWCKRLRVGDFLDAKDKNNKWYKGQIVEDKASKSYPEKRTFRIHFIGWSDDWDLWLDEVDDIGALAPSMTHTEGNSVLKQINSFRNDSECVENEPSKANKSQKKKGIRCRSEAARLARTAKGCTPYKRSRSYIDDQSPTLSISLSPVAMARSLSAKGVTTPYLQEIYQQSEGIECSPKK